MDLDFMVTNGFHTLIFNSQAILMAVTGRYIVLIILQGGFACAFLRGAGDNTRKSGV